jgi:hypothetical protein
LDGFCHFSEISWIYFVTSLKHKRKEFSIADLIDSLDIEENARVKTLTKKELLGPLVQIWYRRITLINPTTTRTTTKRISKRTPQRLNRQLILRRRIRKIALSMTILVISSVNVRTASERAIKNQ